jgi:hypothetical protein
MRSFWGDFKFARAPSHAGPADEDDIARREIDEIGLVTRERCNDVPLCVRERIWVRVNRSCLSSRAAPLVAISGHKSVVEIVRGLHEIHEAQSINALSEVLGKGARNRDLASAEHEQRDGIDWARLGCCDRSRRLDQALP